MNLETAINMIMKRLGNRRDLKADIEYELDFAREFKIEQNPSLRPWYLLTNSPQSLSTVANQNYIALPTDFLAEYEYGFLAYTDANNEVNFLKKGVYEDLKAKYSTSSTGQPTSYCCVADRLYLFPTPDAVYSLGAMYYQSTGALSATPTTNKHLTKAGDWLMAEAGVVLAASTRNEFAMQYYMAELTRCKNRIMGETEERLYRNAWNSGASSI